MPNHLDQSEILDWLQRERNNLTDVPSFLYFRKIVERRTLALREALGPRVELFYSVKANPNKDLLRYLCSLGLNLDLSSAGELSRALECGFEPADMSFVGPGKTDEELTLALRHGLGTIVVESAGEIARLQELAEKLKVTAAISLRLHPREFFSASGRGMWESPSVFGISEDELPRLLEHLPRYPACRVEGIHLHLGSMFFRPDLIVQNFRQAIRLAHEVHRSTGPLKHINLGGGFGIPYRAEQAELDLPALRRAVEGFLNESPTEDLGSISFRVEAGRYLVGSAGCYLTRVLSRKKSFGRTYLVVDGGMNHHLAAVGFGQLLRAPFPMAGMAKRDSGAREWVSIVGSSCYSMDILAEEIEMPYLEPGDWVALFQSGAYGPSFSPAGFLSRPSAREIVI